MIEGEEGNGEGNGLVVPFCPLSRARMEMIEDGEESPLQLYKSVRH